MKRKKTSVKIILKNNNSLVLFSNHFTLSIFFFFLGQVLHAQILEGKILDQKNKPLVGAIIHFLHSNNGTTTLTDGTFVLSRTAQEKILIVSYTGYPSDTIELESGKNSIILKLTEGIQLSEVSVSAKSRSSHFSLLDPRNIESLTTQDFRKAACCSLAESFQTSNTVDLAYTNALVGSKEIQLLGLRGIYTQQLIENRPVFTGILASTGYDYIPGTWLQQINIQKGAASAIYGAQSMTGAINASLKKPDLDQPIYVNGYGDYHGRLEANIHLNKSFNKYAHSGLYLHASHHSGFRDHNKDGFYDDAQNNLLNGLWRNLFYGNKWEGQINFQALQNNKNGGPVNKDLHFNFNQKVTHYNLSGNLGYVGFKNEKQNSGSIYDIAYSESSGKFGFNSFTGKELHIMTQMIYSQKLFNGDHNISTGPAFNYNYATETLGVDSLHHEFNYKEFTPGIFADYDFKFGENVCNDEKKFILSASQRLEYLKLNKWFWTPRFSFRYNMNETWTSRFSIGRAYRFYRTIHDNLSVLTTNRLFLFNHLPDLESSWNYGINIVGKPFILHREAEINVDVYRTHFDQQLVLDLDTDRPEQPLANFYGLNGKSNALSLSSSLSFYPFNKLKSKIGLRYQDTKIQLISGYRQQLFIPKWRAFLSLDYSFLNDKLTWNIISHFVGKMRLPDKTYFPHDLVYTHEQNSVNYITLQSQLNYTLLKWDIYFGCENITNYTQHNAIISPLDPLSPYFTANEIYAPINGIKPYVGFKYAFNRN